MITAIVLAHVKRDTINETAQALEIHPSAVNREWAHACAWLKSNVFAPH